MIGRWFLNNLTHIVAGDRSAVSIHTSSHLTESFHRVFCLCECVHRDYEGYSKPIICLLISELVTLPVLSSSFSLSPQLTCSVRRIMGNWLHAQTTAERNNKFHFFVPQDLTVINPVNSHQAEYWQTDTVTITEALRELRRAQILLLCNLVTSSASQHDL